jgi:hypothetical protein
MAWLAAGRHRSSSLVSADPQSKTPPRRGCTSAYALACGCGRKRDLKKREMLVLGSGSLKGTTGSPTVATTEQRWKEVEDELSFFFFFGKNKVKAAT